MQMEKITLSCEEFENLRLIQGKERIDCHAAFTVTPDGAIWPFISNGNTPSDFRKLNARGPIEPLNKLADLFLQLPEKKYGGRIFIDTNGAFYRPGQGKADVRFVAFEFVQL
jgi:hypothetical protein